MMGDYIEKGSLNMKNRVLGHFICLFGNLEDGIGRKFVFEREIS